MSGSGRAAAEAASNLDPHRTADQVLKDIGLFFAAPFVTLAYLALFPFIGFSELRRGWHERKAARVRNAGR
jgi:hypothetical protein